MRPDDHRVDDIPPVRYDPEPGRETARHRLAYGLMGILGLTLVWSGIVHVFDLIDCDKAKQAYAWAELVDDVSGRQRFTAVLQVDPVKTPQDAVRVSILARYREEHPST
jgi:hypothetical protein